MRLKLEHGDPVLAADMKAATEMFVTRWVVGTVRATGTTTEEDDVAPPIIVTAPTPD